MQRVDFPSPVYLVVRNHEPIYILDDTPAMTAGETVG
jgi:hypothetical protein